MARPSVSPPAAAPPGDAEPRRTRLLEAGLATFVRFGFRKTSMDEVARAAGLSRQGLYLHFATKETLFTAVLEHALEASVSDAERALATDEDLEVVLAKALDAWLGRYVAMVTGDATDLHDAVERLAGPRVRACEADVVERLAKAMRAGGLVAAYKGAGLSARELAETLYATARGLKHACASRDELVARLRLATKALCWPLHAR